MLFWWKTGSIQQELMLKLQLLVLEEVQLGLKSFLWSLFHIQNGNAVSLCVQKHDIYSDII